jgi:hypothetical protein
MGTKSTIAIQRADGTILRVKCNWDGYLENNGVILQEHYLDPSKVLKLIRRGNLGSLGHTPDESSFYVDVDEDEVDNEDKYFYADKFSSVEHWKDGTCRLFDEYNYLLMNTGEWFVYIPDYRNPSEDEFMSLKDALNEEDEDEEEEEEEEEDEDEEEEEEDKNKNEL